MRTASSGGRRTQLGHVSQGLSQGEEEERDGEAGCYREGAEEEGLEGGGGEDLGGGLRYWKAEAARETTWAASMPMSLMMAGHFGGRWQDGPKPPGYPSRLLLPGWVSMSKG